MKLFDEFEIIRRMFDLIRKKQTGCTSTFHKRIGVSRGKLYNLLNELHDIGIVIKYDKHLKYFYLRDDIEVNVEAPIQVIKKDESRKIRGGFSYSFHFFGQG